MRVLPLFPPRERAASVADDSPLESVLVASQTTLCSQDMGCKRTQGCKSPDNSEAHQAKVNCSAQASEHRYMWISGSSALQIPG
jgi:hypothetical protein